MLQFFEDFAKVNKPAEASEEAHAEDAQDNQQGNQQSTLQADITFDDVKKYFDKMKEELINEMKQASLPAQDAGSVNNNLKEDENNASNTDLSNNQHDSSES